MEIDRVPRKTAQFEVAWRDCRSKWIELVHNGNVAGVIELDRAPSTVAEGPELSAGRKRVRLHAQSLSGLVLTAVQGHAYTDSVTNIPPSGTSTTSAAKRSKLTGFDGTTNASRTASVEASDFYPGHSSGGARSIEEECIGVPRRAPEAPMITPMPSLPPASPKAAPVRPKEDGKQHSSSANRSHPYSPSPSPSLQPDASSARSTATLDDALNMPPSLEKRSTPYALTGESLNVPFDIDTALIKSTQMGPPGKPLKPKLRYILQNTRAVLDFDNPLSGEIFRTYNISEFFNVVASRAGKADATLTCLTFVFNWGKREAFVVKKYGGDQYWEDIKERVKGTFLDARNSMKKRTKFELWIKCGDTTNLDDAEEDDDW
jgi:hypothetical protein